MPLFINALFAIIYYLGLPANNKIELEQTKTERPIRRNSFNACQREARGK